MQRDEGQEIKKGKGEKDAVKVMVRVRPFSAKELKRENDHDVPISVISMHENRVDVVDPDGMVKEAFEFHETFWSIPPSQKQTHVSKPFASQKTVFESTGLPAVTACLKGYHTCIFAYGQTGSGKTHTMLGSQSDPGVAPLLIENLFSELEKIGQDKRKFGGYRYSVEISFMEIYNENVKDLFGEAESGSFGRKKSRRASTKKELKDKEEQQQQQQPQQQQQLLEASPQEGGSKTHDKPKRRKSAAAEPRSAEHNPPDSRLTKRRQTVGGILDQDNSGNHAAPTRRKSVAPTKKASMVAASDENAGYHSLRVRQSPTVGTFVEGLNRLGEEQGITCADDVKKAMLFGMEHRATAATQMNETSSRSHAIFQICVKACNRAKGVQRYAHINLVDLAGSERIKMSGAAGDRFTEATRINLSLGTLRRVIDALIENSMKKKGQPKVVPPYRDAMLTWILSESLGGNSKTMMIATVSPAEYNREDSINTLRYALKAKAIVNTVRVNEQKVSVVVSAMMKEMEELRIRLESEEAMNPESSMAMQTELDHLETEFTKMNDDKQAINSMNEVLNTEVSEKEREKQQKEKEIEQLKEENVEEQHENEMKQIETRVEEMEQIKEQAKEVEKQAFTKKIELEAEKFLQVRNIFKRKKKLQEEIRITNKEVEDRKEAFRQEMLVVKRKQFALAFHKAFKQTKTSSSKERMERELQATSNRISHSHLELEWKKQLMRDIQRDNIGLEDRIKGAEREYLQTDSYRGDREERVTQQIKEAQQEKKVSDSDLLLRKTEYKKHQSTLYMMTERKAKESHMVQERCRHSSLRLDSVQNEAEKKKELCEQLEQQKSIMHDELELLAVEIDEMKKAAGTSRQVYGMKSAEISDLKRHNMTLQREAEQLVSENDSVTRELSEMHAKSMDLKEEAEAKESDHEDLRQFVSFRFFPSGRSEVWGI